MWEASTASMASSHASMPSSCGMFVYRLDTSTIALFGMGCFLEARLGEGSP